MEFFKYERELGPETGWTKRCTISIHGPAISGVLEIIRRDPGDREKKEGNIDTVNDSISPEPRNSHEINAETPRSP